MDGHRASASADSHATALRAAIESVRPPRGGPVPDFSEDGGVTVSDAHGHTARIQPLGQRSRVTLAHEHGRVSEAELDTDVLVATITDAGCVYTVVADLLDDENGPGHRSG